MIAARPAREGDLDDCVRIHAEAFDEGWDQDSIAGWLVHPQADIIAATIDGDICGFAIVLKAGEVAEILTIAVSSSSRNRGVGLVLMQAMDVLAVQQGLTSWFLEVAEDNLPALSLYRRFGFHETGRRRRYYKRDSERVDALVMKRAVGVQA